MAKINLLPWRLERRKQRLQEFYSMLGLAAAAAALVSFLIYMYYSGQIDAQNARNQYLTDQIAIVDKQLEEISELDKKKAGLLKRKEVIEQLQSSRSQMVHLFDDLARTMVDGLRLSSIKQRGDSLMLEGRAQSNARVSTYMRNLEASGWMTSPELSIIEAKGGDRGLPYQFSLKVTLKTPDQVAKDAEAAATGTGTAEPAAAGTAAAPATAVTPPAPAPASAATASAAPAPNAAPTQGGAP